jgi:hypothetical protein
LVLKAWNRTCYLMLTRHLLILMSFISKVSRLSAVCQGTAWYFLYESNAGKTLIRCPLYH